MEGEVLSSIRLRPLHVNYVYQAVAIHIFYRNIWLQIRDKDETVSKILASLKTAEAQGRDWTSCTRWLAVNVSASHPLRETLIALAEFCYHMRFLEALELYEAPEIVVEVLSNTSAATLLYLYICEPYYKLDHVGRFQNLRTLHIYDGHWESRHHPPLEEMAAWDLPMLERLEWEELPADSYGQPLAQPDAIRFLSRCRFPRLRKASLRIEVNGEFTGGREPVCDFLRAHATIEDLELVLDEGSYEDVLPVISATRLGLQHCGDIGDSLLRHLPPTVKVLQLPVFLKVDDDDDDDDEFEESIDVFHDLVSGEQRTDVQEIHFSLGYRWRLPYYAVQSLLTPLYFGDDPGNDCPKRRVAIGALYGLATRLQKHGLTVFDERGKTFKDYLV
jgi:hypothetical protein